MVRSRQAVVVSPTIDETERLTGREENKLDREELMTRLLEEASGQSDRNRESLKGQQRIFEPVPECPVEQGKLLKKMEDAVNQLTNNLGARVVCVTEETFAEVMETVGTSRNQSFLKGALTRASRDIVTNMLEDDGVCEALKSAII